jgi:hypothetical protein
VAAAEARIFRQGRNLLALKLRQPFHRRRASTGVLVEATARDLPLESLAAVVPGLKLSGDLTRADLVAGYSREGLFDPDRRRAARVRPHQRQLGRQTVGEGMRPRRRTGHPDRRTLDDHRLRPSLLEEPTPRPRRRRHQGRARRSRHDAPSAGGPRRPGRTAVRRPAGRRHRRPLPRQRGPAQDGEIKVSLEVSEVGLRQSEGRITQATVTGRYVPKADGLDAEGGFRLQAAHLSAGKFTLTQRTKGAKTDWQAKVTVDNIDVDDILSLLPKKDETIAEAPTTQPAPDKTPFSVRPHRRPRPDHRHREGLRHPGCERHRSRETLKTPACA